MAKKVILIITGLHVPALLPQQTMILAEWGSLHYVIYFQYE